MPSAREVDTALERETLGKALYKLERYALSQNLIELAEWAKRELRGYYGSSEEIKETAFEYRTVGVVWLDVYSRPLRIGDPRFSFMNSLPVQEGVSFLEPFSHKGYAFSQDYFPELFAPFSTVPAAVLIPAEQIQALFARIRLEAQTRFHDAVPTITMSNSDHKTPWGSGSFYVVALLLLVGVFIVAVKQLGGWVFPAVAFAALLGLSVIGALQLRHDDRLSEKSFLELMLHSLKLLPLLNKSKGNTNTEESQKQIPGSDKRQIK